MGALSKVSLKLALKLFTFLSNCFSEWKRYLFQKCKLPMYGEEEDEGHKIYVQGAMPDQLSTVREKERKGKEEQVGES